VRLLFTESAISGFSPRRQFVIVVSGRAEDIPWLMARALRLYGFEVTDPERLPQKERKKHERKTRGDL